MRILSSVIKTLIWSLIMSIFLRLIYGLYFAYTVPSFVIAAALGIIGAFILSPSTLSGFISSSLFHILSTSAMSFLYDKSGIFRTLSFDCAKFFLSSTVGKAPIVSLLWPIIFITPIYFIAVIITSGIISHYRRRRLDSESSSEDDGHTSSKDYYIKRQ